MRHYKKGRKLGTDASHTNAIKKNLVVNIFTNDRIKTTLERAKEVRGDIDQVITWAKRGDVHSRRLAIAKLGNKTLVAEIFAKVEQGMFKDRPGGYSRIIRLGTRRGDSATIVIMELVQEPCVKKAAKDTAKGAAKVAETKPTRRFSRRAAAKQADESVTEETDEDEAPVEDAEVVDEDTEAVDEDVSEEAEDANEADEDEVAAEADESDEADEGAVDEVAIEANEDAEDEAAVDDDESEDK